MSRSSYAKTLSCAVVLIGLAVPAASAFTLIELIVVNANPSMSPPPPTGAPATPSSVAAEPKSPQPIGLLLPAVQKVREQARPCPAGQVATPNGQGCAASGLGTASATR